MVVVIEFIDRNSINKLQEICHARRPTRREQNQGEFQ